MGQELKFAYNGTIYNILYSRAANSTLWGILMPYYNNGNSAEKEKITTWHHQLRTKLKAFSKAYRNTKPIRTYANNTIGYYSLDEIGDFECRVIQDKNNNLIIEIIEFFFNSKTIRQHLTTNSESYINPYIPLQKVLPNGNFIEIKRRKGYYIYQHPSTRLLALTNRNGRKNTRFCFRNIEWYNRRHFPKLRLRNVIAIGLDTNNHYWQIDRNCNCTQLVTENKRKIDTIITETINNYLRNNLLIA